MELNKITEIIIGSCYEVYNTLGFGFLEKVYENALAYELRSKKMDIKTQTKTVVYYKGHVIGLYVSDLIVNDSVIVELKTMKETDPVHKAQVLNYLKATNLKLGLLVNFSPKTVEVKRIVN
ncbi:MAG: GxxExxY protein [Treponema sp.]|nr:GxxExxY protein [Candidatus Treponema scatequi]